MKRILLGILITTCALVGLFAQPTAPRPQPKAKTATEPQPRRPRWMDETTENTSIDLVLTQHQGVCGLAQAPARVRATWGGTVTFHIKGSCPSGMVTVARFKRDGKPEMPLLPVTGVPSHEGDLVVQVRKAPPGPGNALYTYEVLLDRRPLRVLDTAGGIVLPLEATLYAQSDFEFGICPRWPCP